MDPCDRPRGAAGWTRDESQLRGAQRQEIKEQNCFARWLDLHEWLYLRPRSDKKSTIRRGAADFSIYGRGDTLFIEFKATPGCKQSQDQIEFEQAVVGAGHTYRVVYSATEAIDVHQHFFGV